jgi:hypothetical protein
MKSDFEKEEEGS